MKGIHAKTQAFPLIRQSLAAQYRTCYAVRHGKSVGLAWVIAMGRSEISIASRGGLLGAVGHVNDHAHAVHLFYHLRTKSSDTTILLFITASRQQTLIVIAELHNPHTQLMQNLHHFDIIFNRRAVLKAKDNTHFTQALCF